MRRDGFLHRLRFVLTHPRFNLLNRLEYLAFIGVWVAGLGLAVYSLGYIIWEFEVPGEMGWAFVAAVALMLWAGRIKRVFTVPFITTAFEKNVAEELLKKQEHWAQFPRQLIKSEIRSRLWGILTLVLAVAITLSGMFLPMDDIAARLGLRGEAIMYALMALIAFVGAVGVLLATRAGWLPIRDWLRSEPGREGPNRWRELRIWVLAIVISGLLLAFICARSGTMGPVP